MRYAHFAEICERCSNKSNIRQSHVRIKLTCTPIRVGHNVSRERWKPHRSGRSKVDTTVPRACGRSRSMSKSTVETTRQHSVGSAPFSSSIYADDILGPSSWVMLEITVSPSVCMHLKHNSCHTSRWPWPTPHPSVICVELLGSSRQPMTGRLATHPDNITVKIQI